MTLTAPPARTPVRPRAARLAELVAPAALLVLCSTCAASFAASHGAITAAVHALVVLH